MHIDISYCKLIILNDVYDFEIILYGNSTVLSYKAIRFGRYTRHMLLYIHIVYVHHVFHNLQIYFNKILQITQWDWIGVKIYHA